MICKKKIFTAKLYDPILLAVSPFLVTLSAPIITKSTFP
jgi:hypothetical protein